jgi:hypothetical protein
MPAYIKKASQNGERLDIFTSVEINDPVNGTMTDMREEGFPKTDITRNYLAAMPPKRGAELRVFARGRLIFMLLHDANGNPIPAPSGGFAFESDLDGETNPDKANNNLKDWLKN